MHIWALEVGLLMKAHDSSKILLTELITHLIPVTFKINVSQHFLCHLFLVVRLWIPELMDDPPYCFPHLQL